MPRKFKAESCIFYSFAAILSLFFLGFLWINFNPEQWYNYDIYADAMVAKHMFQSKSLFPSDWTYGNQLYVTATPTLAALFYAFCKDSVLSLSLASVVMTVLTLLSFYWCLSPFTRKTGRIAGLLCLVGGVIFGTTASSDPKGLQVFYTMASYYSCYLIGILLTLGLWLRYEFDKPCSRTAIGLCLLLNLALSMQSLREMLVLNLPLCAAAMIVTLLSESGKWRSKGNSFALSALAAALLGVLSICVLKRLLPIHQIDVLAPAGGSLLWRIKHGLTAFMEYIGLQRPTDAYSFCKLLCAMISLGAVLYSGVASFRRAKEGPFFRLFCFCLISLAAVFCAGLWVLTIRPIYYFVWYLWVALSFVYLIEEGSRPSWLRLTAVLTLLAVSLCSLYFNFRLDLSRFEDREQNCRATTQMLLEEGVTHVYYDAESLFYAPQIAAYSQDRLLTAPVFLTYSDRDLLMHTSYLCSPQWYAPEELQSCRLLLSESSLQRLQAEEMKPYAEALFSHLQEEGQCIHLGTTYYFYSFSQELLQDMTQ